METAVLCFIILASLVVVFSILLVAFETVRDIRAKRTQVSQKQLPAEKSETAPVTETVVIEPVEEVAVSVEPSKQPDAGNGVWISATQKQTLKEKYSELSAEQKSWYDEIKRYVMTKSDIKRYENDRYEDYKIGIHRIVRLSIKRGVVISEFVLVNQDFRNYINDNNVEVKTAPIVMKIENAQAIEAAKNSIDIAISAVETERQYKKEQRKARRRERLHKQNA